MFKYFLIVTFMTIHLMVNGANSTENRQMLVDIDHAESAIADIWRDYKTGNVLSGQAYRCYYALVNNVECKHVNNAFVMDILVRAGLCIVKDGKLQLREYYISDALAFYEKTNKKEKKGRHEKESKGCQRGITQPWF